MVRLVREYPYWSGHYHALYSPILHYRALAPRAGHIWFAFSGTTGIVLSIAIVYITQYYTTGTWRPVREIVASTLTGSATTIITGFAVGFECVALPVLAISAALFLSFFFGSAVHILDPG